jgi:hypothetical protein
MPSTPEPSPSNSPSSPAPADPAQASLSALIALRDRMRQLHAELEFLRLMLALQKRRP